MKKICIVMITILFSKWVLAQSVGIGTAAPDSSAALHIQSTSKGLLIPSLLQSQRMSIPNPAKGLMVFQSDGLAGIWYNSGTPAMPAWSRLNIAIGWQINGNSNINPDIHFIGTTDNQPIIFRVNKIKSGYVDSLTFNTGFGYKTLDSITSGTFNAAFGYKALSADSNGIRNTAIGANTLRMNLSGSYNTALGYGTLQSSTIGNYNTATGYAALNVSTTGDGNTATGMQALANNKTGQYNTAIGYRTLVFNESGNENTAIGVGAMYNNRSSSGQVAIGDSALHYHNSGEGQNTAVGAHTLWLNYSGANNTAIGYQALRNNGTSFNTALGSFALYQTSGGSRNVGIGFQALRDNMNGNANIAIGDNAGKLGNGSFNISIGDSAMYSNGQSAAMGIGTQVAPYNTSCSGCILMGFRAGYESNGGSSNIAIGSYAGNKFTANNFSNVLLGHQAMYRSTTGYYNVIMGNLSGENIQSNDNTIVGNFAGQSVISGERNILIGTGADLLQTNLNYATAIGPYAKVGISNAISLGDSNQNITVGIGTAYPQKAGLVVNQTVGGYVHAMFGSNRAGVAIESNWPGLGFNSYYTGGRRYIADGFAGILNMEPGSGNLFWAVYNNGTAGGLTSGTPKGFAFTPGAGATGSFIPYSDNVNTLGTASRRWTTVYATNGVINTSDASLKTNIRPVGYGLEEIMRMNPVSFNWKESTAGNQTMIGLLAQEVEKLVPEVIVKSEDNLLGMRSTELIPILIKAIQQQQSMIEKMKEEIETLKLNLPNKK